MTKQHTNPVHSPNQIALLGLAIVFIATFFPVMRSLVETWIQSEDNSHGLLIVPISLFIVWQNRSKIGKSEIAPGRAGSLFVTVSIGLYIFSSFASIATISSLSFVMTIWAIVWSLYGKSIFKLVLFPLFLLLLMIPVPAQFYSMATIPLQLMVSKASAFIVSMNDIPILREGNMLHMPGRTLAVVQACSGLRSLMSLVTLCAILGYLTLSSKILRSLLVFSSVPIAIIVNIIRVVMMIVAFQFFDVDLSKGTLHTIFGVVIFLLALLIVAAIRGILSRWDLKQTAV